MTRILVAILVVALVVTGVVFFLPRDETSPVIVNADGSTEFASMAAYRNNAADRTGQHQVVFIGMDGASWGMIDPMIERGLLPTFARLKREGAWGPLRSVDCFFSPPAWTSMMTGYLPERTGIYTFGKWNPDEQLFHSISTLDIQVPSVWDVASSAGLRVGVTNVPITHPVHPVNGIMVSGLLTPLGYTRKPRTLNARVRPLKGTFDAELDARSYSPPLFGQSVLSVSTFAMALYDTTDDKRTNYDTVGLKVFPTGEEWSRSDDVPVRSFPLNEYSPWFQIRFRKPGEKRVIKPVSCSVKVIRTPSTGLRAQVEVTPLLRAPSDEELGLTYPPALGQEIEDAFGYYLISMSFEPEIIPACTNYAAQFADYFYDYDDWDLFFYVFMAPDNIHHVEGFSPRAEEVYQSIDRFLAGLIERMPEDATLLIASDHGFAQYEFIIDLNNFFRSRGLCAMKAGGRPDYNNSLVFHDQWCLYFNDSLLTPDILRSKKIPVADGQSPRTALIDYLMSEVRTIKEPETQRFMPVELVEIPEDAAGVAPDMFVIGAYGDYFVEGSDIEIKSTQTVRAADPRSEWYHHRDGIYLMWGNKIKPGFDGGQKDIQDVAPTILYLLDAPMAKNYDGRVMQSVIRDGVLAGQARLFLRDYADLTPVYADSYEELQSYEEKLRALGYVR